MRLCRLIPFTPRAGGPIPEDIPSGRRFEESIVIFIRSRDWPAFVNWVNALPPNGTEHLRELGAESWCCDPDGLKMQLNKHLKKMPAKARAFANALLDWLKTQPKNLDVVVVEGGNRKSPRVVRNDRPRIEINKANLYLAVITAGELATDAQTLVIRAATEVRSGRTKKAEKLLKVVRIKAYTIPGTSYLASENYVRSPMRA
jgi:hypothetical protein